MNVFSQNSPESWKAYWASNSGSRTIYDCIAVIYRRLFIEPLLYKLFRTYVSPGAPILHAGSGIGGVDRRLAVSYDVHALDFCSQAVERYRKSYPGNDSKVFIADILDLPAGLGPYAAIYNCGVMEHFNETQIRSILKTFHRLLEPSGYLIMLWPPENGLSVRFFKLIRGGLHLLGYSTAELHPAEPSRLQSQEHLRELFTPAEWNLRECYFGLKDAYTCYGIVLQKQG